MVKLAIISTHPIQYNAPLFRMLSLRNIILIKVFYTWSQSENGLKFDPGFGEKIEWDIPLLDGYQYQFITNVSKEPGSSHRQGIINPTLNAEIESWGADALLVYGWNFVGHQSAINYFHNKIPILFRGDSTLLDEKKGLKKILRRIYLKYVYRKVDIAMYAGIANKAYFKAHGFSEEKLFFMPHAVENNRFEINEMLIKQADAFRIEHKIEKNELVFLFAGKLDENKNVRLLLDVFDKMNSEAHLVIAGSGVLFNELITTVKDKKRIHFLGFQNQAIMPTLYAASNVFVLPSKSETWGLAINEAMAAQNAIIVSDKCGAAFDLIANNGFIVKTNDYESLKCAMENSLTSSTRISSMGFNSLEKIKSYSFTSDCLILEKVVTELPYKKNEI